MSRSDAHVAADPPREPNPEAIAWYVEEAQRLLEDQQRRAESLRTRGGQVAGFGAAVLALIGGNAAQIVGALGGSARVFADVSLFLAAVCLGASVAIAIWGALRPRAFAAISAEEATNFASRRFLSEADLWRVHVRSLHALDHATANAQDAGNLAARAVEKALWAFLAGLGFSLVAIATLLAELIWVATYHPKRFPTVPAPDVPLDQTMAPVDFEGRDEKGKRPPGPLRVWLRSLFSRPPKGRHERWAAGVHLTGDKFVPRVEAESYGVTLKGAGLASLQTNLGTFKCSGTSLEGVAPEPTNSLSLTPKYGECEITAAGGTKYVASVKMNGCHYSLGVREDVASPYAGTWGVACKEPGEAIEYKLTKSAANCLKLKPQQGHEGIAFSQSGEGAGRAIGLSAEVKGLEYEWVGVCGKNVVRTDGVMSGASTLSGEDEDGASIGVWLAGEP